MTRANGTKPLLSLYGSIRGLAELQEVKAQSLHVESARLLPSPTTHGSLERPSASDHAHTCTVRHTAGVQQTLLQDKVHHWSRHVCAVPAHPRGPDQAQFELFSHHSPKYSHICQKYMSKFKSHNLMDCCPHRSVHYPSPKIYATRKPSPKK